VTIDTGEYMTLTGWPGRQLNQRYTLQTISGEALPILKDVFLTVTLGQHPLKIWVFVASITNEFNLGLDILCTYDTSMDLEHQMLHLAEEVVLLWSPKAGP
jgi:hypothetical protein